MNPTCIVRFLQGQTGAAHWILVDREGRVEEEGETALDALSGHIGARALVVLVPGEDVLLTQVQVPTANRQKLVRAIPYALEDQITTDIETAHFVPGCRQSDGCCPVAVVDHACMRAWLEALAGAGLFPQRMLPDILAVPQEDGAWTGIVEGGRFVLRAGEYTGFAGETENFPVLVGSSLAASREGVPERIIVSGNAAVPDEGLPITIGREDRSPADILAQGITHAAPMDLRVGPYAVAGSRTVRWRPWLPAAALALAWILADTTGLLVERWQFARELDALDTQAERLFREVFPEASRVVAPQARMESLLERLRTGSRPGDAGVLETLVAVGPHLRGADDYRLAGLSWRDGTLELDLRTGSLRKLDELKQALENEARLGAEIRQARSEEGEVQGRLLIRRRAS